MNIKAYAKVNLSLDILGVRPDGYHEISTVMQQVSLCDELSVRWLPDKGSAITIEVGTNMRFLPADERNLAYKAAKLVIDRHEAYKKFGPGKVRIDIKKRIPVGAGLGGGSADAAATLHALSGIWNLNMDVNEMCRLGAEIGSDVPFCVMGQAGSTCALAEGTGTKLAPVPGVKCWAVLTKPPVYIATASVYKGFDGIKNKDFARPDTQALISAMEAGDYKTIGENLINVLENYTLTIFPEILEIKTKMLTETSPIQAVMSGSGPTVIGLYESKGKAEKAYAKMAELNRETFLTETM